jgi:hypothetical protein
MALQYVEPITSSYPPSVIDARTGRGGTQKLTSKGGGNQQGGGKPAKKTAKKPAKKGK